MIISLQRENKIIKLCIKGVKEIYIYLSLKQQELIKN